MTEPEREPLENKLILGLGNPGERYQETRHNLGFRVVEEVARRRGISLDQVECRSFCGCGGRVWLAIPQTYMNRSGYAARCLVERRAFAAHSILVVFDDVNLALGRLRLRRGGSPGGHRGMESVIENLRTDQIPRLRLGIASDEEAMSQHSLVDFVLAPFAPRERPVVEELILDAAKACEGWLVEGTEAAMNRFNR